MKREAVRAAAAAEIGTLTQRELPIAYWCEGTKSKPHVRRERVQFMNSDPEVILLFLRFLDAAGVNRQQVHYRVCIHETADVEAAERFWLEVTGPDPARFHRSTLKRHNPKTVRKNVGDDYHGCLCVAVWQSADLYRRIQGWARAAMNGTAYPDR